MKKPESDFGDVKRVDVSNRLRGLVDWENRALAQISRTLVNVVRGDAGGIGFLGDRFIYFSGRFGELPHREVLAFPVSMLEDRIWIVSDVKEFPGYARMNTLNGKFSNYRSFIAAPIKYNSHIVAMLICYSNASRFTYESEGKISLLDLCSITENLIAYEAALASISRKAMETIEQYRGDKN